MNKCSICGAIIGDQKPYMPTAKCYPCYKRDQTGNGKHKITEVMKRLKANKYLFKKNVVCGCGCKSFFEHDDFYSCRVCEKIINKIGVKK